MPQRRTSLIEHRGEYQTKNAAIPSIAAKLGIAMAETLRAGPGSAPDRPHGAVVTLHASAGYRDLHEHVKHSEFCYLLCPDLCLFAMRGERGQA